MTEITKEEAKKLKEGTKYIVYNPLTTTYKEIIANKKDLAHSRYAFEKLRYFLGDLNESNK